MNPVKALAVVACLAGAGSAYAEPEALTPSMQACLSEHVLEAKLAMAFAQVRAERHVNEDATKAKVNAFLEVLTRKCDLRLNEWSAAFDYLRAEEKRIEATAKAANTSTSRTTSDGAGWPERNPALRRELPMKAVKALVAAALPSMAVCATATAEDDPCRAVTDKALCHKMVEHFEAVHATAMRNLARGMATPWDLCHLTVTGVLRHPIGAEGYDSPACRAWFDTTPAGQARKAAERAQAWSARDPAVCGKLPMSAIKALAAASLRTIAISAPVAAQSYEPIRTRECA